jgi:hypothetical protein
MSLNVPSTTGEAIAEVNGDSPLVCYQQKLTFASGDNFKTMDLPLPTNAEAVWTSLSLSDDSTNVPAFATFVVDTNGPATNTRRLGIVAHTDAAGPATGTTNGTTNLWLYSGTSFSSAATVVNGRPNNGTNATVGTSRLYLSVVPVNDATGASAATLSYATATNGAYKFGGAFTVNLRVWCRNYVSAPTT